MEDDDVASSVVTATRPAAPPVPAELRSVLQRAQQAMAGNVLRAAKEAAGPEKASKAPSRELRAGGDRELTHAIESALHVARASCEADGRRVEAACMVEAVNEVLQARSRGAGGSADGGEDTTPAARRHPFDLGLMPGLD